MLFVSGTCYLDNDVMKCFLDSLQPFSLRSLRLAIDFRILMIEICGLAEAAALILVHCIIVQNICCLCCEAVLSTGPF